MKTTRLLVLGLIVAALITLPGRGFGQVSSTETINVTLAPNQPVETFYPNVFDPTHPKLLTFTGIASALPGAAGSGITTFLDVQFDWLDALGGTVLTDPVTIPVQAGVPQPIDMTFTIPFCPERVSLHLLEQPNAQTPTGLVGVTWPMTVDGDFTHECLVPEADALIPAGLLLTGMTVWGWRRRARKA